MIYLDDFDLLMELYYHVILNHKISFKKNKFIFKSFFITFLQNNHIQFETFYQTLPLHHPQILTVFLNLIAIPKNVLNYFFKYLCATGSISPKSSKVGFIPTNFLYKI